MTLAELLKTAASALQDPGVGFALIGGLGVSVRTEPHFTRDVDFAVTVADDGEAERHVSSFVNAGFRIDEVVEQTATGRLAMVRLDPSDPSGAILDLLFASSGIETEIVDRADHLEVLPGISASVAQAGDLIALKLLSRNDDTRPQDAGDLRLLAAAARTADWELAASACETITARGFNPGRDLLDLLAELRATA